MKKNKVENSNAITLIALVVTIVVLLILAGITIQLVFSDGGIFNQANKGKEQTEIAVLKEKIDNVRIAYIADRILDKSLSIDDLWNRLIGIDIIETKEDVEGPVAEGTNNVYTLSTKDGYTVEIIVNENGIVEIGEIVKGTLTPVIRSLETRTTEASISVKAVVSRLGTGTITYSYRLKSAGGEYTEIAVGEDGWYTVTSGITKDAVYEVKVVAQNEVNKDEKIFEVTARDHKVTSIELEKSTAVVGEGESIVLKIAKVLPDDAENKEVIWSSDDINIATVEETTGKVTGVAIGSCNIIATAKDGSNITATCSLTVLEKESDWGYLNRVAIAIANDSSITSDSARATGKTSENEEYDIEIGNDAKSIFKVRYTPDSTKPNEATVLKVRVLGFKHDTLAENTSYGNVGTPAAISFEFVEFLGENHEMFSSDDNTAGWKGSTMRTYLNGDSDVTKGSLVTNLSNKNYIKKVTKPYLLGTNATVASTDCSDWLWLLSCSEIWSNGRDIKAPYGLARAKEGERYKFYSIKNPDGSISNDTNIDTKKGPKGGSASHWWLRSPYYDSMAFSCFVHAYGRSDAISASTSCGVAPGFSI